MLYTLEGHSDVVYVETFSPDGSILASTSADRTIKLWRIADGTHINTLKGHTDTSIEVAFSPDGSILASVSADHTLKLWSVQR